MSSALSVDLRERVVRAVEAGASRHQAAKRFGVSLASASRWCGQFAREGHVAEDLSSRTTFVQARPEARRMTFSAMVRCRRPIVPPVQPDMCGVIRTLESSWNGRVDGCAVGRSAEG